MTPAENKPVKPMRLPLRAPPCFRDQAQWQAYREVAVYCTKGKQTRGFTYCSDCTPEHRDAMKIGGRCEYPGTEFRKLQSGILIGRRKK